MSAAKSFSVLIFIFTFSIFSHAAPAKPLKEWNFLVFINGVNDLDEYGALNINQMETMGSTADLNILVQWGSWAKKTVRRVYVTKDNDPKNVSSRTVQDIGRVDMGDYREFVKFVEWAHTNYPAKRYFVVIWDHGTGWHSALARTMSLIRPLNISHDERTGNSFTTPQMGQAMRDIAQILGRKIDVYASDACLMGMIEIATEMADSVEYYVGSQDLEPGQGWSYGTFLQKWAAQGFSQSADVVSRIAAQDFVEAYSPNGYYGETEVTMSAFDMSKLDPFLEVIKEIRVSLASLVPDDLAKVRDGASASKFFAMSDYIDLKDFIGGVAKSYLAPTLLTVFDQTFQDFVIANHQNLDARTFGVSIWIPQDAPWTSNKSEYEGLVFNQRTQWSTFLERMNAAPKKPLLSGNVSGR